MSEQQRLGHSPDRYAHDDLVGELGQLPGPVRSDMDGAPHGAQHRFDPWRNLGISPPAMMASVPARPDSATGDGGIDMVRRRARPSGAHDPEPRPV